MCEGEGVCVRGRRGDRYMAVCSKQSSNTTVEQHSTL